MLAGLTWKGMFRAPALILLPLLLVFTVFPSILFATVIESKSPKQRVSGRVIQFERFGQKQVFVKYRYAANGQKYSGASVGMETSPLQNLARGAALEISFDKTNPQNSVPAFENAAQENFPWPLFLLFPLMAAFFFLPFFFPQLRAVFLARKLFTRGVLATGKILFVKVNAMQTPVMPGGSSQIFYEWPDQKGVIQRGSMKCDNMWLVLQFHSESAVVVAYNPKKPAQSILLEPFIA